MDSRIVIIGGVAGGMSAATRAWRVNEQAEIVALWTPGVDGSPNGDFGSSIAKSVFGDTRPLESSWATASPTSAT